MFSCAGTDPSPLSSPHEDALGQSPLGRRPCYPGTPLVVLGCAQWSFLGFLSHSAASLVVSTRNVRDPFPFDLLRISSPASRLRRRRRIPAQRSGSPLTASAGALAFNWHRSPPSPLFCRSVPLRPVASLNGPRPSCDRSLDTL